MSNSEYHTCEIVKISDLAPNVKSFHIRYPVTVDFQSGQFVIIDFGTLNHQFPTRSYSIADAIDPFTIELCVVLKEEGAATPKLFNQELGAKLQVSMPQGRFVLPESITSETTIGFICTGTGVAPFRAMIKDLLEKRKANNQIHLFFGTRNAEDILYKAEFEHLAKDYPNFYFHPTLSRQDWEGLSGYVHAHYPKIFESKPPALIYLCGWTNMIKEARETLKSYGYSRTEIKVEFYD